MRLDSTGLEWSACDKHKRAKARKGISHKKAQKTQKLCDFCAFLWLIPFPASARVYFLRLLPLLCQLTPRLAGEFLGLRNQFDCLQYLRIVFKQNTRGFGNAEPVVENFVPDGPLDEVSVVHEVLFVELNSALRNVLLELIDNRI